MLQNYLDLLDNGIKKLAHLEAGTTTFIEYMEVVEYEFYILGVTLLLLLGLVLLFIVPFIAYLAFFNGIISLFKKKYKKEWKIAEYREGWLCSYSGMLKLNTLASDESECLNSVLTGAYETFKEMDEKKYEFFSNQQAAKELIFSAYEKYQNTPEQIAAIVKDLHKSLQEIKILEEIDETKERYQEAKLEIDFITNVLTTIFTIIWILLALPILAML